MGEVKQTNFRIDQDSAAAFRKFCEDNGMNQAQGFDHVMQVVELDRAKTAAPGRATEIESFEKSVKDIMAAYLNSLEINAATEARIREQFAADLTRKDKTIDELREKVEQLQAERDEAETLHTAAEARESAATARMEAAQRTAADPGAHQLHADASADRGDRKARWRTGGVREMPGAGSRGGRAARQAR